MSKNKNPSVSDPLHTIFSRYEMTNARLVATSLVVNVILLLALIAVIVNSVNQQQLIGYLSANRIMYGFATEDGSFTSVERRPEVMIVRYAKEALYNSYNYDRDAIASNYNVVLAMYAHQVRQSARERMESRIRQIRQDDLSQTINIMGYKVTEHADRYEVEFDSVARQFILDSPIGRTDLMITVTVAKVAPTETRREGLAILAISDRQFVRQRR